MSRLCDHWEIPNRERKNTNTRVSSAICSSSTLDHSRFRKLLMHKTYSYTWVSRGLALQAVVFELGLLVLVNRVPCYFIDMAAKWEGRKEGWKMRGRGVKERLKGKDSLREKKAQRVSDWKKKNQGAAEGGREGRIQTEAEIKRIKEERERVIEAGERYRGN